MDLQVLLQVAATRELLVTILTSKRLLARMNPLVAYQIADLRESLLAARKVTLVRLGLVVDAGVLLKRGILRESLIALGTIYIKK